jgi:predicted transposase/invertase (TIGR01784 family)
MIEEAREKARRDESARMAWAKRTGIEQGIEQGIERIAKNLLQEEMPVARVAKLTGLSEGKISELQKTPKN